VVGGGCRGFFGSKSVTKLSNVLLKRSFLGVTIVKMVTPMGVLGFLGAKKRVGWQILTMTATHSHFSQYRAGAEFADARGRGWLKGAALLVVLFLHALAYVFFTGYISRSAPPPPTKRIEMQFVTVPIAPVSPTSPTKPIQRTTSPPKVAAPVPVAQPVAATPVPAQLPEPQIAEQLPAEPVSDVPPVVADEAPTVPAKFDANYLDNPKPQYPPLARRMRLQGEVLLQVVVNEFGRPESVIVLSSSGAKVLDDAAVDQVKRWTFVPATQGGHSVRDTVHVPIRFSLSG